MNINPFMPNPTLWNDNLTTGDRTVSGPVGATYNDEDGNIVAVTITEEGLIIDLHTDDDGNPASLSMMWDEWVEYLLEHGVR